MTATQNEPVGPQKVAQTQSAATGLAAVREALARRSGGGSAEASPASAAGQRVARGDIRVIEPLPWMEGHRRLAVVRRVDADREVADLMLAHTCTELATDADAVIASRDSGLPHPLVVECHLRGPVWLLQVRERAGALDGALLEAIASAVVDGDPAVEGVHTGLPLAGPADPRWRFKKQESAEWRALTDDCAAVLLSGEEPWPIEAERLSPHAYEAACDGGAPPWSHQPLEETVHLLATRPVAVELRDFDPATFDLERWVHDLGPNIGLSAFAAFQPTWVRALSQGDADRLQEAA